MTTPAPTELRLSADKKTLTVAFKLARYSLPAELLRVESPSAEVKGHGPNTAVLVPGKKEVTITGLQPVGNYAVRIVFSDGHATGLYTWATLAHLGQNQAELMASYQAKLAAAGLSREA